MAVILQSKGPLAKLVVGNQFLVNSDVIAEDVSIADAGNYFTSNNVEGALQEVGADLANVQPLESGQGIEVADGMVNIGEGEPLTEVRTVNIGVGGGLVIKKIGGGFTVGFFSEDGLIEFSVGTSNLVISESGVGANRYTSTIQTLTISAGLIAWNMALGQRAKVTLTENATLSNPTNATAAFPDLEVRQDGMGGWVLSFGSNFVLPIGFTAPPTTANSYVLYHFQLRSDGKLAVVATPYAT